MTKILLAGAALVTFIASPLARADYASTVLSQGPAAYFRLNETTQPLPLPINATNTGSVGSTAGDGEYINAIRGVTPGAIVSEPASAAVQLTASVDGNRVRIPNQPQWNTAGPFSVEFWIRPDRTNAAQCVAANIEFITTPTSRSGWLIYQGNAALSDGNGFVLRLYNSTGASAQTPAGYAAPLNPAAWYHVVGTFDGTHILLYVNGDLQGSNSIAGTFRPNTNSAIPLTLGSRADGAAGYFTSAATFDEAAYYNTAMSAAQVLTHYQTGTNAAPVTPYRQTVLNDTPVGYWRFNEPGDPAAVNLGTLGSAANGKFLYPSKAGVSGPSSPPYVGFDAVNKAGAFTTAGGGVEIPALALNTNTVTFSCWINVTNAQQIGAGIVVHGSGANACGLTIDQISGGLGLGYIWNGSAYRGWSPTADGLLPQLPDSNWAYAALVIRPLSAEFYLCDADNFGNWASVTNTFNVSHTPQAFAASTFVGTAAGLTPPAGCLQGAVDEVSIFRRALSAAELYTQYAAAVGGVKPRIFEDLTGPVGDVAAGDPIVLTVSVGGTPDLTYTWHKIGTGTIATTTNGVLAIPNSALADAGTYDVTISNGAGSADSQPVVVTVITPSAPEITGLEGFNNRTIYVGATLRLAVTATGGGLKYQWSKDSSAISGATASAYIVPSVTNSYAGIYSVLITNIVGTTNYGAVAITIPTFATNSYEAAMISSGPEAWWRLDELAGSTTLLDGMARHDGYYTNVNGTVPPVALGVAGALVGNTNTAASFSANGGVGVIPYSPLFSANKFTIEGWAKTTVLNDTTLTCWSSINGSSGESWRTTPAGYWRPVSGANTSAPLFENGQTNALVQSDTWTHLVICYDATASASNPWFYYINGFRAGSYIWTGPIPNSGGPFIIGGRGGVTAGTIADYFWNGKVDEVAIYQRVLGDAEIQAHYSARGVETLPPSFSGPLLSQTVVTGKRISFSTTVFGTAPGLYWYKGTPQASAPVATGTNAFWINPTALGDSSTYSLVASNSMASVTNTASLTVISGVNYANITNDLVLHLTFDTDTTDSSGRGNDGTPSSPTAPAFVAGHIGAQALEYTTVMSGSSVSTASYVTLGAVAPADLRFGVGTSFTVGLWVKLGAGSLIGDLPFIGTETNSANNPGWVLAPSYKKGGWQWDLNDGSVNVDVNGPDASINDGNWHNFVLVVDRAGAAADTYLDGVRVGSQSIASLGSLDKDWPIVIGQDPSLVYTEGGTATLDDIGIWRQALTPTQVAQIESAGRAGRSFNSVAPVLPTLTVGRSGGNVVLTYTSGTLVESTDPTVPKDAWTPVAGAGSPWAVTPSGVKMYYSVRQ